LNKESGKSVDFINDPSEIKVAIVRARFNSDITEKMAINSEKKLKELGVKNIINYTVPGSFEIPLACNKILDQDIDGIIAIGCLIKGETDHYKYIAENTTYGIQKVSLEKNKPIIFGVLTVNNIDQAEARIKSSTTYAENLVEMVCNY
jgi:6,7-dimethyl-8-ribityllumazine synthase